MPSSLYEISEHAFLAERAARFQSIYSFNEDKALTVRSDQNRGLLAIHQQALRESIDLPWIKRVPPLDWYVDVIDCDDVRL
jgi:hypothetical protein